VVGDGLEEGEPSHYGFVDGADFIILFVVVCEFLHFGGEVFDSVGVHGAGDSFVVNGLF
jgi:hypothetical protein